jgi:hypothetical protein
MARFGWGMLAVVGLAISGCGHNELVKVHGIVTLDGKPVENAMVTFLPSQRGGKTATGRTGTDGSFQLTTRNPNDGAMPGDYLVIVEYEEGTEVPPAANVKQAHEGLRKAAKQKSKKPPKYVIPATYSDPQKTVLKQKVPPDGPVKLELKSK